jgi:hypothetical protein
MKLTKQQQEKLKLIDNQFQQFEKVSKTTGVNLNTIDEFFGFGFPNFADEQQKQMISKNKSRQEVFEKSRKATPSKDKVYSAK